MKSEINKKIDRIKNIIRKNINTYVVELQELIKIPSISTDRGAIKECAHKLAGYMMDAGISTEIQELPRGNPVLLGEFSSQKNSGNSNWLLVYGHYDVHPVGKLIDWNYSPFGAEISDGKIYGRGSADNKGNLFSWVKAVEILTNNNITIPVNLLFLFEGEEEIGSPHLRAFVKSNKSLLKRCSSKVVFEPRQDYLGRPIINLGWKGIMLLELSLKRGREIHSSYTPLVENPVNRLISALSTIQRDRRVLIEGFYEDVEKPSEIDHMLISRIPLDKRAISSAIDFDITKEDNKDSELLNRLLLEPSFTIIGIQGGYVDNPRTVIPSESKAIVEFRLIPRQSSKKIISRLKTHLSNMSYNDIRIKEYFSSEPSITSYHEPIVKIATDSIYHTFKTEPLVYPSLQGTSPDWIFTSELKIPSIGMGAGYHHLCHSPDEYISIEQYSKGIELAASLILNSAAICS